MLVVALTCALGLIPSNTYAQRIDLTDTDDAGEKMVACWHHADKHLRTAVTNDTAGMLQIIGARLDCENRATDGKIGSTTSGPVKIADVKTAYRGAWLGTNYEMTIEFYDKFVCTVSGRQGQGHFESWTRAVNVKDDKSPEPNCALETYRLVSSTGL
jgi:hypothetical protein